MKTESNIFLRLLHKIFHKSSQKNRRLICLFLKKTRIPNDSFYFNLRFNGKFKLNIPGKSSFSMVHYGGSIENENFWKGLFTTWENDNGWIWMQLCENSKVIFDIGANTGIYSLVAKSINPKASVYAFEPSLQTSERLVENSNLNNFDIHCETLAISNHDGKQVFYDLPISNQTTASLSPEKMKNNPAYKGAIVEYEVKTMKLSTYIEDNEIHDIDLIKIDIEMHEPEAIEGLGKYLMEFKPVIIFEVLSNEVASKLNKLIDLQNFQLYHLVKGSKAERLDKFLLYEGSLTSWEWNYILFHNDLKDKIRNETTLFENLIPPLNKKDSSTGL